MSETTLDESPIPLGSDAVADPSELLYAVADQSEKSSETQPFRFLDLPRELRFMVYEELMDNKSNELKYTQPRGFEVESVYIDNLHYPSLLLVCKVMEEEYWSLCLKTATMWITYSRPEYLSSDEEDSEDEDTGANLIGGAENSAENGTDTEPNPSSGEDEDESYGPREVLEAPEVLDTHQNLDAREASNVHEVSDTHTHPHTHEGSDAREDPELDTNANADSGSDSAANLDSDTDSEYDMHRKFPLLSTWLKMPKEALAKLVDVVFKFEVKWDLPTASPFAGIAECVLEMPSLKSILIWSDLESWTIESACTREHGDSHFRWFVEGLCGEEFDLLQVQEDHDRRFNVRVGCDILAPLYETNKRYRWPRRRHLVQGIAPIAGLPKWGYAIFRVLPLWDRDRPNGDAFEYHGEEVIFERIEYDVPVPERSEYWEGCSEDEYEWTDDSDWAIRRLIAN